VPCLWRIGSHWSCVPPRIAELQAETERLRVRFGRPLKLTAHQRKEAIQRLAEGAVQADLARSYGVSQATISRLAAPSPFEPSPAGG
jgi:hypothetical protein